MKIRGNSMSKITNGSNLLQPILLKLESKDKVIRREAVRDLGENLEIDITESIPILIEKFEDENCVRREAVQALVKIGRRANGKILSNLIRKLQENSLLIRWGAAFTIGSLGKYAEEFVPTIISCIEKEKESSVRKKLVWSLGKIGIESESVLDILEKSLGDTKSEVRYKAAQALGRIGGERAIDALVNALLNDNTAVVRATAANGFKKIGEPASRVINCLIDAIQKEEDQRKKMDIAFALCYLEEQNGIGIQELEKLSKQNILPQWQRKNIKLLLEKNKK